MTTTEISIRQQLFDRICRTVLEDDPEEKSRTDYPIIVDNDAYVTDGRIAFKFKDYFHPISEGVEYIAKNEAGEFYHHTDGKVTGKKPTKVPTFEKLQLIKATEVEWIKIDIPEELNERFEIKEDCDECSGRGWGTCNFGHQHDCPECNGKGEIMAPYGYGRKGAKFGDSQYMLHYLFMIQLVADLVPIRCFQGPTQETPLIVESELCEIWLMARHKD